MTYSQDELNKIIRDHYAEFTADAHEDGVAGRLLVPAVRDLVESAFHSGFHYGRRYSEDEN